MANPTTVPTNRQCNVTLSPHIITHPCPSVSQSTLAEILKQRRELKEAEATVKALKDTLAERERAVIEAIEDSSTWPKASVTPGILEASVAYQGRRNVKWREVAEEYLGSDFCELVVEETEPTVYPKLVIA